MLYFTSALTFRPFSILFDLYDFRRKIYNKWNALMPRVYIITIGDSQKSFVVAKSANLQIETQIEDRFVIYLTAHPIGKAFSVPLAQGHRKVSPLFEIIQELR